MRRRLRLLVTALVVLPPLLRWLPVSASPGNLAARLDLGAPWRTLELDRELAAAADEDTRRALARGHGDPAVTALWEHAFRLVAQIRREGPPGAVLQVRGLPRNLVWQLAYDLYPARLVGPWQEQGGQPDDAFREDADWALTLTRRGRLFLRRLR